MAFGRLGPQADASFDSFAVEITYALGKTVQLDVHIDGEALPTLELSHVSEARLSTTSGERLTELGPRGQRCTSHERESGVAKKSEKITKAETRCAQTTLVPDRTDLDIRLEDDTTAHEGCHPAHRGISSELLVDVFSVPSGTPNAIGFLETFG